MRMTGTAAALVSGLLAGSAWGVSIEIGEAEFTFGSGRALWQEAKLAGRICSSFAEREAGKPIDVSGSKAAELKAKVKALDANAACKLTRGRSKLGDETYTIENGLVKAVVVPALGGRIIEISNKATGSNIFIDNYQQADARPDMSKGPPKVPLGGWLVGVHRGDKNSWKTQHEVEVVKRSAVEVVLKTRADVELSTWGIKGPVKVEQRISLARGSAVVKVGVRITNTSTEEREMQLRNNSRHALGSEASDDEFWFSSLGYATFIPPHEGDAYAPVHAEQKVDTWQAILDRDEREGVMIFPGGEINGNVCIWGGKGIGHYSYENQSELREHVVDGSKIEISHDYAPVLNFDAVTFGCPEAAVCFQPHKFRVAPGERVKAVVAAALVSGSRAGRVTLRPRILSKSGEVVKELRRIIVDAPLLAAEPKEVEIVIPADLARGRYDLDTEVLGPGGNRLGSARHRIFVSSATGLFLDVLRATDDGYGRGLSVTGTLERASVRVARAGDAGASGTLAVAGARLPWEAKFSAAGGGGALKVELTTDFSSLPADARIAAYGLSFPVNVGDNEKNRAVVGGERVRWDHAKTLRTTIGGSFRDEQYMLDQTRSTREQDIPYYYLSDGGGNRMPQWRYGGVIQTSATNAWIWKAAGDDVAPVVVQTDEAAAGWVDVYSPLAGQGVLVKMSGMSGAAPKGLVADGEAGTVEINFFPPHVLALSLAKAPGKGRSRAEIWGLGPDGKATFTAFIRFHAEDLAGDLTKAGNRAAKIRGIVEGLK